LVCNRDLILFDLLLPLVNAPFDWFALGLTRALLRRGLAPGGIGPFFYALVDAVISPFLILVLALVCVVLVQAFDDLAAFRAGSDAARIFPLNIFFQDIAAKPGAKEFYWVWFVLFSTMIPSVVNLIVASAACLRGLTAINKWILRLIPSDGSPMPETTRLTVSMALAGQIACGALLGLLAIYVLIFLVRPVWLPFLGGLILSAAEFTAGLDLPAQLGHILETIHFP